MIKNINDYFDDDIDSDLIDEFEEVEHSECWEVKIDSNRKKILFMVDGVEKLSTSLNKFKNSELNINLISSFIKLLKEHKIEELKKLARF